MTLVLFSDLVEPPPPIIPGEPPPPPGAPVLSSFAQEVYPSVKPLLYADADNAFVATLLLAGLSEPFQLIDTLVHDQVAEDGSVIRGWGTLLDPDTAPDEALPWLGQFVGVTIPPSVTSPAEQRTRIKQTGGFRRGSPGAIIEAAKTYLTGDKRVILRERDGSPYHLSVATYASETPDPDKVLAELLRQKPAGLTISLQVFEGQDYLTLRTNHATYQDVKDSYTNYGEVRSNQP